jgi:hypothetical protein
MTTQRLSMREPVSPLGNLKTKQTLYKPMVPSFSDAHNFQALETPLARTLKTDKFEPGASSTNERATNATASSSLPKFSGKLSKLVKEAFLPGGSGSGDKKSKKADKSGGGSSQQQARRESVDSVQGIVDVNDKTLIYLFNPETDDYEETPRYIPTNAEDITYRKDKAIKRTFISFHIPVPMRTIVEPYTRNFVRVRAANTDTVVPPSLFEDGLGMLYGATSKDEIYQALNAMMYKTGVNTGSATAAGSCANISRAIQESLATGRLHRKGEFDYLEGGVRLEKAADRVTDTLLSARQDKSFHLPGSFEDGWTEADAYRSIPMTSQLRGTAYSGHVKALEDSFKAEYSLDENGLVKVDSAEDIKNAFKAADDGTIGFVFVRDHNGNCHIFPVVKVMNVIVALPNYVDSPSQAEKLSDSNCRTPEGGKTVFLGYALSTRKLGGG